MAPDTLSQALARRQERLRVLLDTRNLPFIIVSNPLNIFYLTGFRGSAGVAVFGASDACLWVDPRYTLQAREESPGVRIFEERRGLLEAAGRWIGRKRPARVGYDDRYLSCAAFEQFRRRLAPRLRLQPAGGIVEELRSVKDSTEIERIRRAGKLTAAVLEEVRGEIRPDVREAELAVEIEYRMKKAGAEGVAFETIVASGRRAAWPHARASSKLLKESELVIFDLGAIVDGYAADMSRTFFLGEPGRRVRSLYKAVLEAQRKAVEAVVAGKRAGDADSTARRALGHSRLARYFTHSTGHGVGLEIHESPRLARGQKDRLQAGNVVTVEPGIYIEGLGGVRIEDTVLVGTGDAEILTPARKDDWIIS